MSLQVKVDGAPSADDITALAAKFPFTQYFSNAPQPIFAGEAYETDLEAARGCMRHLDHIFERLQQYRPLELLPKVGFIVLKTLLNQGRPRTAPST